MLKYVVLVLSVVSVCAMSSQATLILSQNFDTLPLGSIETPTMNYVGDPTNTGGAWRMKGYVNSTDVYPSISTFEAYSGTQSLAVARGTGALSGLGWTTAAGVSSGQSFTFTSYVYPISYSDGTQGSWTMYVNNYSEVQTYNPVDYYITPTGHFDVFGKLSGGSEGWIDTGVTISANRWTGIRFQVTSWNTGSGAGTYDAYINTGSVFQLVKSGITFNSSELYSGVNSVEIDPQAKDGNLCGYIDNVSIVTPEPITISILGLGALFVARRRS
jgi:hypothetical protein